MGLVTGDTDPQGNFVLRRRLTDDDRRALNSRAAALAPWIAPAKKHQAEPEVLQLIISFGATGMSKEQAAALAATYVQALQDLPLWTIQRACRRFMNGEVHAEELGIDRLDTSFRPSTAQVRRIAIALLKPFAEESTRIWMTLRGSVARTIGSEERARVGDGLEQLANQMRAQQEASDAKERESDHRRINAAKARTQDWIVLEYEAKGLQPIYQTDGVTPIALGTLISVGWRIDEIAGRKVLVKPAPPAPARVTEST